MALLGIDVGTTGIKATITDNDGEYISSAYREYPTHSPRSGWFELDPDEVWEKAKIVIKNTARKCGEKIISVSSSSLGESFVMLDKKGKVLSNSMLYTDTRGSSETSELIEKLTSQRIMEKTGLKPALVFSLPKLMWIKKNRPELYDKIDKIIPFGGFILYKLGGPIATDITLGLRTMALNTNSKKWDEEIIEASGIDADIFPEIHETGTIIGHVSQFASNELGLSTDIQIVAGAHDQIMCAIGSGILHPGEALDGMGSVDNISPIFQYNDKVVEMATNNYATVSYLNGLYTTYAYVNDGGTLLRWYRDNLGESENIVSKYLGISVYDIFNDYCSQKPTNILILPHFSGSAMPYMDSFSKGAILGMDLGTNKQKLYRAILEGISYEVRVNIENLEAYGVPIDRLRASGGGSRSDIWLQIKSDILNKEIDAVENTEAGTMGVIITAGVAAGTFDSYESAMKKLIKIRRVFKPNKNYHEQYNENFERYKKIYEMQKNILKKPKLVAGG